MARRATTVSLILPVIIWPVCVSEPVLERFEYRAIHMGTKARVVLYATDSTRADRAAAAAFARLAQLDRALSDYRMDSELSAISARAGAAAIPVGAELYEILRRALELAEETDGGFDVTAGPLSALWRAARLTGRSPAAVSLQQARELVGWRFLELDTVARTVRLARPGMRLDLGGIAKGYAVDRALDVLRGHGVDRALVALGGEIALGRAPPDRQGWRIAVGRDGSARGMLVLENVALSSSGDTEQFVELDGVRHSHVIDPRTGLGLTDGVAATVIAPDGMTADAYATIVTVLDPARRATFIAAHPEARFYVR